MSKRAHDPRHGGGLDLGLPLTIPRRNPNDTSLLGAWILSRRVPQWTAWMWRAQVWGGRDYLRLEADMGPNVHRVARVDAGGMALAPYLGSPFFIVRTVPTLGTRQALQAILARADEAGARASMPLVAICTSAQHGMARRDEFLANPGGPSPHWAMTMDLFAAPIPGTRDDEDTDAPLVVCQLMEAGEQTLLEVIEQEPNGSPRIGAWIWQVLVTLAASNVEGARVSPSAVLVQHIHETSRYKDVDWIYLVHGEPWIMSRDVHHNTWVKVVDPEYGDSGGGDEAVLHFLKSPEWPAPIRDRLAKWAAHGAKRLVGRPPAGAVLVMGARMPGTPRSVTVEEDAAEQREKRQRFQALLTA